LWLLGTWESRMFPQRKRLYMRRKSKACLHICAESLHLTDETDFELARMIPSHEMESSNLVPKSSHRKEPLHRCLTSKRMEIRRVYLWKHFLTWIDEAVNGNYKCLRALLLLVCPTVFAVVESCETTKERSVQSRGRKVVVVVVAFSPPCAKDVEDVKHQQEKRKTNDKQLPTNSPDKVVEVNYGEKQISCRP
jgi:hypothetical protein